MRLLKDIYDELKKIVFSRPGMLDLVLPPLVFLIMNLIAGGFLYRSACVDIHDNWIYHLPMDPKRISKKIP